MANGKVLSLYMTSPDMLRSGHRLKCENFDCDPDGILGDKDHGVDRGYVMLLVSKSSYDIIEEADIVIDKGLLLENIYVDIDLYHLKKGSVIEIGETLLEVNGSCESYDYLYSYAPEVPDLIRGKRGLFVTPMDHGRIELGDEVSVLKEA